MHAHTTRVNHTLALDKMMGEKRVLLAEKEQDIEVLEAALMEAQARDLNPWDNQDELLELVELQKCLGEVEVGRVTEASELAVLEGEMSKVLVFLGRPPIEGIPQDPGKARDILEAVDVILEHLREAHASSARP
jgi:hypothetical protein